MFCRKCGADIGDAKFCPKCGEASGNGVSSATTTVMKQHPNGKYVNKIVYGILAIIVGSFGIHRFYSGKIVSGIVYLVFCWTGIPSILGFVEGIVALVAKGEGDEIYVDPDKFFIS